MNTPDGSALRRGYASRSLGRRIVDAARAADPAGVRLKISLRCLVAGVVAVGPAWAAMHLLGGRFDLLSTATAIVRRCSRRVRRERPDGGH